jgi:hypothetical protein
MTHPACRGCQHPVDGSVPRYAAGEPHQYWHWDCWVRAGRPRVQASGYAAELAQGLDDADQALARLRRLRGLL